LGALLAAGCSGSKSTSTTSTQTTPLPIPSISTTIPTTQTETTVTLTQTASSTTTTGAINVRVPARFTIQPGGSVTPSTITIPAHLPVELIVVSNARAHRITLRSTSLTVAPHAQAEALIDGLRAGSYPLHIDGAARALLTIGGAPGP
jgi:hypothetical protein